MKSIQEYYESSDDELAQRYVKDHEFLTPEYCRAALAHRYDLYPFIEPFVRFDSWAGRRVLEVGCGQGADLYRFAAAGAEPFGVDLTAKHCRVSAEFARSLGSSVQVTQADARALPFADGSFDLVYSFGGLLLMPDLGAALGEIARVLRPEGTVIAMFYNQESLHYWLKTVDYYGRVCDLERLLGPRRLVDWFTDGFGYPRTHHYTPHRLQAEFSRVFEVQEVVVRNLTPDQIPLFDHAAYPDPFWQWLGSRLGFYVMIRARR